MRKHVSGLHVGAYVVGGLVGLYLLGGVLIYLDGVIYRTNWIPVFLGPTGMGVVTWLYRPISGIVLPNYYFPP